jgi:hypothetical protein
LDKLEAVRRALRELGDGSNEEVAAFIEKAYGVAARPPVIPVLKATLRDKEMLAQRRPQGTAAAPAPP